MFRNVRRRRPDMLENFAREQALEGKGADAWRGTEFMRWLRDSLQCQLALCVYPLSFRFGSETRLAYNFLTPRTGPTAAKGSAPSTTLGSPPGAPRL